MKWSYRNQPLEGLKWGSNYTLMGVYVIYKAKREVIYVGQGNIPKRLRVHQETYKNCEYFVTWVEITDEYNRFGAESYLQRMLSPRDGNRSEHPEVRVDLPWY